jgi:PAS domain S-box-containing protein
LLGALVVLFVLTELVGTVYFRAQSEDIARRSAAAGAQFSAELAASEVASALSSLDATTARTAASPGISPVFDPGYDLSKGCTLVFGAVGPFQTTRLDFIRADGSVFCSSLPIQPASARYTNVTWLAGALRTATFAAPIADPRTGGRSAVSAVPVRGLGVVAAFVDLGDLGPALATKFGGPNKLEFLVTTTDGRTVVGRSIDSARWAGASLVDTPFELAADATDHPDLDGIPRIYGRSPVTAAGWTVFAGVTRDTALAAASSTALADLAVNSALLLALLMMTLVIYRAITSPLWRLARSVRDATSAGRPGPVPVSGPKEIAELAQHFNAMIATVAAELTERQRAEAQARGMLDSGLDAIVGMDERGVIIEWNPQAEQTFGWTRAEAVGARLADLIIPERYRTRHAAGLALYLRTGEGPVLGKRIEMEALARDGHEVPVELSIAPVRTATGQIFSASIRDLTRRREEEQLRAALEHRLRQSERLESIGRLVGGIAHDFNNLLAIVLNYSDFIARRLPPGDPSQDDLIQIQGAATRATTFTRQLLTFAKRGAVHAEDFDLTGLIEQLRDLLKRTLPATIVIELRLVAGSWSVHADRGQIEQVLLNLVVNAGDAMPDGGRLVIATSNLEYDEDSAAQHADLAPGRYVLLTVTDTGTGMPKAVLDHAFEPFFTTKDQGKGTGLGLATAYGVVQQAGGRISLYSEVGKGTTVRVLLPARVATESVVPRVATLEAPAERATGTILVVEDESGVREATRRILASAGYDVLESARADEALALVRDTGTSLDLVLTDMVMPGMSGLELARLLRDARPGLRVIYMTGYSEELLDGRVGAPEDTVIYKPFTRQPLLAAVATALRTVG